MSKKSPTQPAAPAHAVAPAVDENPLFGAPQPPLADEPCLPPRSRVPPLDRGEAEGLLQRLEPGWAVNKAGHLERDFRFPDWKGAMDFAVAVGDLAEAVDHHPLLHITWGRCGMEVWTHSIGGLHPADFVLAARADRAYAARRA